MEELKCIYEMSLINEGNTFEEASKNSTNNVKIIIALLSKPSSIRELATALGMPICLIQININRLLKSKVIRVKEEVIINGSLEKIFELTNQDIQILNKKNVDICDVTENDLLNAKIKANNFANLTKEMMENISKCGDKPYDAKGVFIKVKPEQIDDFKVELEKLIKKFEKLENPEEQETYGFISVLAPYGKV